MILSSNVINENRKTNNPIMNLSRISSIAAILVLSVILISCGRKKETTQSGNTESKQKKTRVRSTYGK